MVFFPRIWVAATPYPRIWSAVTCASIEITNLSKDIFLTYCENCAIAHILNVHLLPCSQLFLSTMWLCCGLWTRPSSLLPQFCSGTLVCSREAEYCLELERDACHGHSKELPGRDVTGHGISFLFQCWHVMLSSAKGRTKLLFSV